MNSTTFIQFFLIQSKDSPNHFVIDFQTSLQKSRNFLLCLYRATNPATKAAIAVITKIIGLASITRLRAPCATAAAFPQIDQFFSSLTPVTSPVQLITASFLVPLTNDRKPDHESLAKALIISPAFKKLVQVSFAKSFASLTKLFQF